MRVVATAGHVDHGKSTLLRALTGMEPDRYEEERRRGLTIDLGFVWTTLASGRGIAFVDVPGHARLVRTMLAGVGTVDLCLFVVAANEGWMPQSEEHLRILELVGATAGVIAVTKVDTVDSDLLELAKAEIAERVAGTFLERCPVVEVDGAHGLGLDDLRSALDGLLDRAVAPVEQGRPRLWVDRSFSIKGAGTVVTGTLGGGELAVGDELAAVDRNGRSVSVRVRGLQSQEQAREVVGPGQRVAVNVVGAHHETLGRGAVLVRPDQWRPTARFDAAVRVVSDVEIGGRGALFAYIGTTEQPVRLRLLEGRDRLKGGDTGTVRVWLPTALPLVPGDRFVLRDTGRGATVAGGEVLDLHPALPLSKARPDRSTERLVLERGWIEVDELEAISGERLTPTVGHWLVSAAALNETLARVEAVVGAAGPLGADLAAFDDRMRAVLPSIDGLAVDRGRVTRIGAADPLAGHPWLAALEADLFQPPPPDDVPRPEVRELVRRGVVVEEGGVYFAVAALEEARLRLTAWFAGHGHADGAAMSELRDLLGTSRKYALPLVTLLDRRGVTLRRGDLRVAGRRIDQPVNPEKI